MLRTCAKEAICLFFCSDAAQVMSRRQHQTRSFPLCSLRQLKHMRLFLCAEDIQCDRLRTSTAVHTFVPRPRGVWGQQNDKSIVWIASDGAETIIFVVGMNHFRTQNMSISIRVPPEGNFRRNSVTFPHIQNSFSQMNIQTPYFLPCST